jgi:DNA repair protein RAD50
LFQKRKLQTNEYKDIDERHRVKMIEVETCDMAVHDLDIYYNALDKSLLRYHGLKIAEINKIVKELWSLTYKGEDITSIRLTSDQDQSSKATRSYNYRVVMTKGTTELDMRGRCSAGQRVLASLVIRLALAETFCINCGVMALDEPTTNLDYANKRGLAAALAQIIAHRASQNNFQLVTITHDEEFVSMMKNELATHTGFAMPERYFQVSREESSDGKYYSKIHAIDWDEI